MRLSRSILKKAMQTMALRRYHLPAALGPDAPPLYPLGPPLPLPQDLVVSGPLAPPPRTSDTDLQMVDRKNVIDTMNIDMRAAQRLTDERSLIEQFEQIRPALKCRGILSPYKLSDVESRFINDAYCHIYRKSTVLHLTAADLMFNLVTMPTDFWHHCLDYLMTQGVVVYEEWDRDPIVCIRFVLCDQGAGFLSEKAHYLRGESDGSYDPVTRQGGIAATLYDEKDLVLFEMALGFTFKDSLEAETYGMYLVMKRAIERTLYFYVITDNDKIENVLRAGYLLTKADRQSKLPLLCSMRRHFKGFSSRRMPRDGIRLVDAVMKIDSRYQARELVDDWQENLNGKPLFCIDGHGHSVKPQQKRSEIFEDVCYIVSDGEERLHTSKHIINSFYADEVLVMAKNIEPLTKFMSEVFKPRNCRITRTSSCSALIDFGYGGSARKLCLVFDTDLQKEPYSPVEGYKMTILFVKPHEKASPTLQHVPELSARSKACYKYGDLQKMPPSESEDVAAMERIMKGKEVVHEGKMLVSPKNGHIAKANYTLMYNGEVLETSRPSGVPYQFTVGQGPFKALDLAVRTMKMREHSKFTISADLACSEFGLPANIPLDATLKLDVQLASWSNSHDICGDGGLMKKVLKPGSGKHWEKPKDLDKVTVKFEAKLDNGTIVSKSDHMEFTVKDGYLCPAVGKAIVHMKKGERAHLTVGPEYGFGGSGRGGAGEECAIPEGATLHIDIELISWKAVTEIGDQGSQILKMIHKEGEGQEFPNEADDIRVKVTGRLQDGTVFMRKGYLENEPFVLNWDSGVLFYGLKHAILKMKKGEVAFVTLPPDRAYGSIQSSEELAVVLPNSTLVYEVELVSFKRVQK